MAENPPFLEINTFDLDGVSFSMSKRLSLNPRVDNGKITDNTGFTVFSISQPPGEIENGYRWELNLQKGITSGLFMIDIGENDFHPDDELLEQSESEIILVYPFKPNIPGELKKIDPDNLIIERSYDKKFQYTIIRLSRTEEHLLTKISGNDLYGITLIESQLPIKTHQPRKPLPASQPVHV